MAAKRHTVGRSGKKLKLFAERVRVDRGGYANGQYFGTGAPIFRVSDEDGHETYVRRASAKLAKSGALPEIERQAKRDARGDFERRYPGGGGGDFEDWYLAGQP